MTIFLGIMMAVLIVLCVLGTFALGLRVVRRNVNRPGWQDGRSLMLAVLALFVSVWLSIFVVGFVFYTFAPQIFV